MLLEARVKSVSESIEALQNKLDTPFDNDYIIALAKEKLNYCLPDEVIFYNDLIN
jgi:cell division protein FtsB